MVSLHPLTVVSVGYFKKGDFVNFFNAVIVLLHPLTVVGVGYFKKGDFVDFYIAVFLK